MSICAVYQYHLRFLFLDRPRIVPGDNGRPVLRFKLDRKSGISSNRGSTRLVASASSSPSLGASGVDYPEQLLGAKPKKKIQKIAGIDQEELQDPALLADPDSCFCEFRGVQIHHKICDPEPLAQNLKEEETNKQLPADARRIVFPMILLHGFGASVFSWNQVMKPLAHVSGSKVLAFDRPAFGLTSRVNSISHSSSSTGETRPLNPYSMIFSVLATLYFIDFLAAEKVILVGHSAGSLVAVDTYFEAPERVAALILVAPAIFAPLAPENVVKSNQNAEKNQIQGNSSESSAHGNPLSRLYSILSKLTNYISQAVMHVAKGMGDMISSFYRKALSALLGSSIGVMLIRMVIDKFGIPAVRNSWYDPKKVSDDVLQGYTKPLRVKGWDRALVEFTIAMLTDSASESKLPLDKRLGDISCPVLIVTGDRDRLVPPWNSERLSRVIPGAGLEIIKNCGHLPQEEHPEEFVSIVSKFLQRVFGTLEEQRMQLVT